MINEYISTIQNDFETIKKIFQTDKKYFFEDKNATNLKILNASIRLVNTGLMGIGIGITFFALPILSSGVSLIGLALGISLFIIGHDLFKIIKNGETSLINLPAPQNEQEQDNLLKQIFKEMDSGTILQPLLKPLSKYWKPNIFCLVSGNFDQISFDFNNIKDKLFE